MVNLADLVVLGGDVANPIRVGGGDMRFGICRERRFGTGTGMAHDSDCVRGGTGRACIKSRTRPCPRVDLSPAQMEVFEPFD